jgi:hypothetical protein
MSRVSATSLTSLLRSNLHDLAVTIKIMGILNVAKAEEFFRKVLHSVCVISSVKFSELITVILTLHLHM